MRKKMVLLITTAMMMVPALVLASVGTDGVHSQHIKESTAGSTDQDTNSGYGIKTGHIVDTAITTTKLADGAVTDSKISGTISTSKLNVGTAPGTVAAGNHVHKYANVAIVAQSGGNYTDPVAAMNDAATWCGGSACLIKIMPGIYDIRPNMLWMASGIEVEGSGPGTTKILGTIHYEVSGGTELRDLSVENGTQPIQMLYNYGNKVRNVKVTATAADGIAFATAMNQADLAIVDSEISGFEAIRDIGSMISVGTMSISGSKITGTLVALLAGGFEKVNVTDSVISSPTLAIQANSIPGNVVVKDSVVEGSLLAGTSYKVINTKYSGPVTAGWKCIGVYDANFDPITCQ